MSYQGKKSIPHITVSGCRQAASRCPRSFVSGAGKGVRREMPHGWRRGDRRDRGRASPGLGGRRCPLLLLLELRSGRDLILNFYFYFLIIFFSPIPPPPHRRGSALSALSPARGRRWWVGAGRGGQGRAGGRLGARGDGAAALPRSRARGGSAAGRGRTKEGGDEPQHNVPPPPPPPGSGQGQHSPPAGAGGGGPGWAGGTGRWEVGKRGSGGGDGGGGSVENQRAP